MAGGFTAGLTYDPDPDTGSVEFLASQHYMTKRGGITIDATQVPVDENGRQIVAGGTVMVKDDATGKYLPFNPGTDDGTGTFTGGNGEARGLLFAGDIDCSGGDTVAGLLIHGSVLEARCTGVAGSAKDDLAGRITFQ